MSKVIYLCVKTHKITGLKYLCKTTRDPYKYRGSGVYWKRHLKIHGTDHDTEIIKECYSYEELTEWGLYYSSLWNVVESNEWANLRAEEGDGGDTSQTENYIVGMKQRRSYSGENNPMYDSLGGMNGKTHSSNSKIKSSISHKNNWSNMSEIDRVERSNKVKGEKNGMFGKTPKNALQIEFNNVTYFSLKEAHISTGHTPRFLKKHGKIL